MARVSLDDLDGRAFDVAIIGAGVNGASAAHHLAAEGYSVLLVDKGDFGAGTSSRSSRLLGNGLHYLADSHSLWDNISHPIDFMSRARMARSALESRAQMVKNTPERVYRIPFYFPLYEGDTYAPWQLDIGVGMLRMLGIHGVPLNYRRMSAEEALSRPLLKWLKEPEKLRGVAVFDQHQLRWPERIVVDTVMDGERMGLTARNYTTVSALARDDDSQWTLDLVDSLSGNRTARVRGRLVLNMAGIWIDRVHDSGPAKAAPKVTASKGIHLAIRLPPECRDTCVTYKNRDNEHMYCVPWHDLHYIGPTETVYEGDLDNIVAEEDEIAWLIDEFNHLLPGMALRREDVLYSWAGARPWTRDKAYPKGARSRIIHDMGVEGMPGVLAMTGGPIMSHRSAGKEALDAVRKRLAPSGRRQEISYGATALPGGGPDEAPLDPGADVTVSDLRHAAEHQAVVTLDDLLFRRTPLGWSETMAAETAAQAARAVADILEWDEARIEAEVAAYREKLRTMHYRPFEQNA